MLVLHDGGSVRVEDGEIAFQDVDALTILLAADTDYLNPYVIKRWPNGTLSSPPQAAGSL